MKFGRLGVQSEDFEHIQSMELVEIPRKHLEQTMTQSHDSQSLHLDILASSHFIGVLMRSLLK